MCHTAVFSLSLQTLMISQHQLKETEAELSKVQNHLKELNREYRARLARYVQDITVRVHMKDFIHRTSLNRLRVM